VIQDGHHDAIMPVKQEGKDVSEVVCSTLAQHEEIVVLQLLG
jgi:hypothetical protein